MNTKNNSDNPVLCTSCYHCMARKDSVFSALSFEEIHDLQDSKSHLVYHPGELVFKEGQFPSGIYIITKGKIKVSKYGFEGREQIVRFAKEGDITGYRALISEEKYSCSAYAIIETHVCFLSQKLVEKYLRNNSEFAIRFMKLLAHDLRVAEEKAMHMAQKTVRERIAESILILKEVYGFEEDGSTININLKRDEIASIAGTVRESATRQLSEFNHDEIILLTGKKIKILNLGKLVFYANLEN